MRLLAISDLHLAAAENRAALERLPAAPTDWLILAGDVAEQPTHLGQAFAFLASRFAKLIWVPGNHELWTVPGDDGALRGQAKYQAMVDVARHFGVVTPEDPFPLWPGPGGPMAIVPLFLLYDYSFRPADVPMERVLEWAWERRLRSADEVRLSPVPHASRQAWCAARVAESATRMAAELPPDLPTVLVNHFPLRADLVTLRRIPRFSPWCGTAATEDWHRRFNARVCVHGHLHVPGTHWRDGVRFEEVSLGYPRQWQPHDRGPERALRQIWPPPMTAEH